ncbi:trypsin-like peptidase domain-containing protein [Micromonospora sp. NRRL B-16802]|nr:trypsin-like peptidase domain-containing protein [Micromonospora sp. NRRL B-16802]
MSYPATAAVQHVRQATVHISSKRRTGTGFFVERNILLTCAHVLEPGNERVRIRLRGQPPVGGTVLKRLPSPAGRDRISYPFPDLAFIGVDGNIDHPVAEMRSLLLHHGYNQDAAIAAFGFNRDAPEPDLGPDIVRMAVQGPSEPYVKAHAQVGVAPGMSGAPIVELSTGRICGMLKYYVPEQKAAWFIDALDLEKQFDAYRALLGRFEPRKPRLFLPESRSPLWKMLVAQKTVSERLPYRVVEGEVPLSTVYVEQRAESWMAERRGAIARGGSPPVEPSVIPASEMLSRHRNALIVGGPGGGKSTLLQHLVTESAAWWLRPDQPEEGEEPSFGPAVAIRCAATRLLTDRPWYESVADAVKADLSGYLPTHLPATLFEVPPQPGVDWLVLVDGLDEIFNPRRRAELIERLAAHIATYGAQARFVVSSRVLAATEFHSLRPLMNRMERAHRLGEYNLRPFDRPAVESFASRWYHLRDPEHAADRQRSFLHQVDKNRMMTMVRVPLLCTIAADVHQQSPDEPLPYSRAGLYRRFVDALLQGRQTFPSVRSKVREQLRELSAEAEAFGESLVSRRRGWLTFLAEQRLELDRQPSVGLVRTWLARQHVQIPDEITDQHIREVLVSTGLIVNRGDSLEFTHQSIAEYLHGRERGRSMEPQTWLARVQATGLTSTDMFELAAWTEAGNDPNSIILELAAPGRDRQFPQLTDLADLLADGAATIDDGSSIAGITMAALEDAAVQPPATLQAINQAARAVLQRAPDPSPLIELINNPETPELKRIEVATVLLTDGDQDHRRHGLAVLMTLGRSARRTAEERLPALRALADSGNGAERRNAVQHLASLVETGPSARLRVHAAAALINLGEPAEALAAFVGRLRSPEPGANAFVALDAEVEAFSAMVQAWVATEGGEPNPDPRQSRQRIPAAAWSTPQHLDEAAESAKVDVMRALVQGLSMLSGRVAPERLEAAATALIHDRSVDWSIRSQLADALYASGQSHRFLDDLLNDTSVAVTRRLVVWYPRRHSQDPAGADSTLRSIVRNERAGLADRRCALDILGNRGGPTGSAFLALAARDPTLPPTVRVEAATVLGRRRRHRTESLEILDELSKDQAIGLRWRWAARVSELGVILEQMTTYLVSGATLDNRFQELIREPVERVLARLMPWMRRGRT